VFAQVVARTGTGSPKRSGGSIRIQYTTAHGVSRATGLPLGSVVGRLRRLTDVRLTIEKEDGGAWRTNFEALCCAAEADGRSARSVRNPSVVTRPSTRLATSGSRRRLALRDSFATNASASCTTTGRDHANNGDSLARLVGRQTGGRVDVPTTASAVAFAFRRRRRRSAASASGARPWKRRRDVRCEHDRAVSAWVGAATRLPSRRRAEADEQRHLELPNPL
jgi:hypothetical protein